MKYIGIVVFVVLIHTFIVAQENKNTDHLFVVAINEMKSHKVRKIKPKVSCYEVDYCTVRHLGYNLKFEKWNGDSLSDRRIFVGSQRIKIISFKNKDIEINKSTFPEYDFSTYIFDRKRHLLKIMSSLPSCTGLSCKYQIIQVIDLSNKLCYEKIIRYYR